MQPATNLSESFQPNLSPASATFTRHKLVGTWTIALAFYLVLSLVMTFPLILHLGDSFPGVDAKQDNGWFVWLLWLFRHALETNQNPARANQLFVLAPQVQNFTPTFFNELLGWPLQYLCSPLAVYNLLILLGFVLSGFTMYVLAGEFVANQVACFVAGCLFDFSNYHFAHVAVGHLELSTLQWLPFCVWRVFIFYRQVTVKNACLVGVALALVAFSSIYYVAYFIIPFALLFLIGKLWKDWQWFKQPRHLLLGGLALLVAIVIAVPPLLDFLRVDSEMQTDLRREGTAGVLTFSAKLNYLVSPGPANPYLGGFKNQPDLVVIPEIQLFLGYTALGLSVCALIMRSTRGFRTWFWGVFALFGVVLSLGPGLSVWGISPYNILYGASLFGGFRVPARLGVLPMFATSLLSAFALEAFFKYAVQRLYLSKNWVSQLGQVTLALGLLVVQLVGTMMYSFPFPITNAVVPAVYQQIAADPTNGLVLEMPLQVSGSYEYYQTVHHKGLVDGYLGRVTPRMWNSLDTIPYLSQFDVNLPTEDAALNTGKDIFPLDVSFKQGLAEKQIKYVLLHHKWGESLFAKTYKYLSENLGKPFYQNEAEDVVAWKVPSIEPNPLAGDELRIRLDWGWNAGLLLNQGQPERLVEQDGHLLVSTAQAQARTLSFKARAIFKPQTLQLQLNNEIIRTIQLNQLDTLQTISASVSLKPGLNVLELKAVEPCTTPHDYDQASIDVRCLSFGVQQLQFTKP